MCKRHCVDLQTNLKHCGRCRTACTAGQTCIGGICTSSPCTEASSCGNPVGCGSGASCFCLAGVAGLPGCYDAGDETCTDCGGDSDCVAMPGGICAQNTCCPNGACVYPSTTCGNPLARRSILRQRHAEEATMFSQGTGSGKPLA